jgi:hypothetical protein
VKNTLKNNRNHISKQAKAKFRPNLVRIIYGFHRGLPKLDRKKVILVVMDRLSKCSYFMALVHPYSAYSVAKVFMDPIFVGQFYKQSCKHPGVNLHYSTTYHFQFNG